MYKLVGPNILIFIPAVVAGIVLTAIIPSYIGVARILSLFSLMIGEAGMSFVPVIALYPRAKPLQAIILAIIYFFTTFIICSAAWGINNFGWPGNYAFMWKDGEFYINTYSLFIANIVSLIALIANFKLVYDEELTKGYHKKSSAYKYKKPKFTGFQRPLLKRPNFEVPKKSSAPKQAAPFKTKKEFDFEENLGKPFEFEPEIDVATKKLPEESSGGLFAPEIKEKPSKSDFFEDEEPPSPFPPSNIKDDLAIIFEQYSSLNAVKKLTSGKIDKIKQKKKDPPRDAEILVHIEGQDVHEASFRQISEKEKLEEIKEEIKKELEKEIKEDIKKEIVEEDEEEEVKALEETLAHLSEDPKILGSMYLNQGGNLITKSWNIEQDLNEEVNNNVAELFNFINEQVSKTKQGKLYHLLLESEDGIVVLADIEDKILSVYTQGTGETYCGQILRTLSELEENK